MKEKLKGLFKTTYASISSTVLTLKAEAEAEVKKDGKDTSLNNLLNQIKEDVAEYLYKNPPKKFPIYLAIDHGSDGFYAVYEEEDTNHNLKYDCKKSTSINFKSILPIDKYNHVFTKIDAFLELEEQINTVMRNFNYQESILYKGLTEILQEIDRAYRFQKVLNEKYCAIWKSVKEPERIPEMQTHILNVEEFKILGAEND